MDKINICDLSRDIDKDSLLSKYASNGNLSIEFSYLSDFKSAKILRDIVGSICNHLKLDKITTSRITLIVDEMNNNAIEYGSQKGDMNKIRFQTESYGGNISMIIEVEDSGKGPKAKKSLDMEILRAHQLKLGYGNHSSIRGRGLFMIIVTLVDRLYFKDSQDGGLIVGVKKNYSIS